MNGFLNLLKPPGMTSSDAVVQIRRTLPKGVKVGHAGTLDPEAAGVLPIMVGKAARLFDVLTEKEKEYVAEIAFGASTDTQDAQGTVVERSARLPDLSEVEAVLPRFIGNILQVPPAYSALKVNGKTAYDLARSGETVELAPRPARVDSIECLERMGPDSLLLRVRCGKGVYIRTLCHDIGRAVGCPAHMRFLLRTQSGVFTLEQAVTLETWTEKEDRTPLLMRMDEPLAHLPMARVGGQQKKAVLSGSPLTVFEEIDETVRKGGLVRVYCGDVFAGLGRWQGEALRFQAMLMEQEESV